MNGLERFWFKQVTGNFRRWIYETPLILSRIGDCESPNLKNPEAYVKVEAFPSIVIPVTLSAPEVKVIHGPDNRDKLIEYEFNTQKFDVLADSVVDPRNLRGFLVEKTEDRNRMGGKLTTGYLTYIDPAQFRIAKDEIRELIQNERFERYGSAAID